MKVVYPEGKEPSILLSEKTVPPRTVKIEADKILKHHVETFQKQNPQYFYSKTVKAERSGVGTTYFLEYKFIGLITRIKQSIMTALSAAAFSWSEKPTGTMDDNKIVAIGEDLLTKLHFDSVPDAMEIITGVWEDGQEEGSYYNSWKLNIASAFSETFKKRFGDYGKEEIPGVAIEAAELFLNRVIADRQSRKYKEREEMAIPAVPPGENV